MLETLIEELLSVIIPVLELMGIFVVTWSTVSAFWVYLKVSLFIGKNKKGTTAENDKKPWC